MSHMRKGKKFDEKGEKCVFLGISEAFKGWFYCQQHVVCLYVNDLTYTVNDSDMIDVFNINIVRTRPFEDFN